jgi:murein L,D-transpeptidase YcbB/YkuD
MAPRRARDADARRELSRVEGVDRSPAYGVLRAEGAGRDRSLDRPRRSFLSNSSWSRMPGVCSFLPSLPAAARRAAMGREVAGDDRASRWAHVTLAAALTATSLLHPARAFADSEREVLRARIEVLRAGGEVKVAGAGIASREVLPRIYEARDYSSLWTNPDSVDQLLAAIVASYEEGLDPDDYHLREMRSLLGAQGDPRIPELPGERANVDLLLTDAFVRLELHLRFGKVDPVAVDATWDFLRDRAGTAMTDEVTRMAAAVEGGSVGEFLAAARPNHIAYAPMKAELARLRAIEAAGGWPVVPPGPTLHPGDFDARVAVLRQRLVVSGDLAVGPQGEAESYDDALAEAVRSFQRCHGLTPDGVTGPRTYEALNAPPRRWIDQLRVNLERARWMRSRFENGVIVDIAGFDARYVRDGETVWQARAMVGKPYRSTPVLSAKIRTLVVNPTWTVPPTILENDILPEVRRDPGYLAKRQIRVFGKSGTEVDPATVPWSAYSAGTLPYTLRQGPGPENPLGRIKFLFPNPHFVYLHDTPSRSLFQRTDRAASSGCIRVDRPLELAALLVEGTPNWSRERIEEVIASGKTQAISIARPVPIYLLYWTVGVSADGRIFFKKDVYDRDRAVLTTLDREYGIDERALLS